MIHDGMHNLLCG
jgi:hypothetical protein